MFVVVAHVVMDVTYFHQLTWATRHVKLAKTGECAIKGPTVHWRTRNESHRWKDTLLHLIPASDLGRCRQIKRP